MNPCPIENYYNFLASDAERLADELIDQVEKQKPKKRITQVPNG